MVLHPTHLSRAREQVVEVSAPTRRVVAVPIAADLCPIQNTLNATANSCCCLGLGRPNGFENSHYEADVDGLHRELSENGRTIGPDGGLPLTSVLHIPPAGSVHGHVG